jgi:uncharacterized protein YhaN
VAHRRAALATALDKLGRSVADDASLAETTAIADEVVSDHTARAAALRSAHDRVTDAKHREREAAEAGVAARTDLNDWQVRWLAEVTKLGVDPDLKPDLVRRVIDAVEEMFVQLAAAAKDKARIDGIERDTRVFNAAVATLVADVAPELADLAEDQAVAQLHQVLDAAQNDATQAELIELQLTELKVSLEETDERQHTVGHELERLMKDARCSTTDDLAAAEEHSAAVLRVRGDLAAIEEQMTLLAASSPDEIAAEVHAVDLNLIEAELQQLGQRKGDLSRRHKEVGEEVGEKRALLDRICGGDDAAQLHAEAESIKAEIRTYAERYAQLRLASAILRQQIDDFRERSHGPLLTRAGHFFSKLTCGGCIGLATGFDGKGNVVLLGRRKNGREITVEQMSTGSRDQLYLGLRLATLEQQAERGDPLPLIVDDLFEGYDDKRAAAGFEALAELAEKTQIIFFTHHRHLVEIAQQTLSAERCVVQELGERLAASAEAA